MNFLKNRVAVSVTVLVSVVLGAVVAIMFYMSGSSSLNGAANTDEMYPAAVRNTVDDQNRWAFEASVVEGSHPWGITRVITSGNFGDESRSIEFPELGVSVVEDGRHSRLVFADKNILKIKRWDGTLALDKYNSLIDAAIKSLEESKLVISLPELLSDKTIASQPAQARTGEEISIVDLAAADEPQTLPGLIELLESAGLRSSSDYDFSSELEFLGGQSWVSKQDEKLVRVRYSLRTDKGRYVVEVVPHKTVAVEKFLAKKLTPKILDSEAFDEVDAGLLSSFGLSSFSAQLADILRIDTVNLVAEKIKDFAKEKYYYPTELELKGILRKTKGLENVLGASVSYSTAPAACDNKKENYCASYELTSDAGWDGLGDADLDGDLGDIILSDD